jgi:hypothetical protein
MREKLSHHRNSHKCSRSTAAYISGGGNAIIGWFAVAYQASRHVVENQETHANLAVAFRDGLGNIIEVQL